MSPKQQSCHLCETLATQKPEAVVFDDGTWVAFNVADTPGWTMLAPREHLEGIGALSGEQAAALGPLASTVGGAVSDATGADRVHVVFLGDTSPHFHLGFFPRQAGEAGLFDTTPMRTELSERQDAAAAHALTGRIRAAVATAV